LAQFVFHIQTISRMLSQFDTVMQANLQRSEGLSGNAKALDSEATHLETLVVQSVLLQGA
jgi:hypothetical protein